MNRWQWHNPDLCTRTRHTRRARRSQCMFPALEDIHLERRDLNSGRAAWEAAVDYLYALGMKGRKTEGKYLKTTEEKSPLSPRAAPTKNLPPVPPRRQHSHKQPPEVPNTPPLSPKSYRCAIGHSIRYHRPCLQDNKKLRRRAATNGSALFLVPPSNKNLPRSQFIYRRR